MGIKVCLKVNLIFALLMSLFTKTSLLTVINGNINSFLVAKIIIHCGLIFSIGQEYLLTTISLFILDITLYSLYIIFELIYMIAILMSSALFDEHSQQAIIGIIVSLTIASIDLIILSMVRMATKQMRQVSTDETQFDSSSHSPSTSTLVTPAYV